MADTLTDALGSLARTTGRYVLSDYLREDHLDRSGLFDAKHADAKPLEAIDSSLAIILAPPRWGKSWSAQRLAGLFALTAPVRLDCTAEFEPPRGPAWIIDALDESLRDAGQAPASVARRFHAAVLRRAEAGPVRLFARPGPDVFEFLEAYKQLDSEIASYWLAPIDSTEAATVVCADEARVRAVLDRVSVERIGTVLRQPELLRELARSVETDMRSVLRAVADASLGGKRRDRPAASPTSVRLLAEAAAVAAHFGDGSLTTSVFSRGARLTDLLKLQQAADGAEVLANFLESGVLRRATEDHTYRFVDLHTQELLVAFGLASFSRPRLMGLITYSDALRPDCREVARYLATLRPDLAPWLRGEADLSAADRVIDTVALEMHRLGAGWISLDVAQDLERADVVGALRRRLATRTDEPAVVRQWARMTVELRAAELVPQWTDIALTGTHRGVRAAASNVVAYVGTRAERLEFLQKVRLLASAGEEPPGPMDELISGLVHDDAIPPLDAILTARSLGSDAHEGRRLVFAVESKLTLDDARLLADMAGAPAPWDLLRELAHENDDVWVKVAALLAPDSGPRSEDLPRVANIIVAHHLVDYRGAANLRERISADPAARRALFLRAAGRNVWVELRSDDLAWLQGVMTLARPEQLCDDHFKWLYWLGARSDGRNSKMLAEQLRPGSWRAHVQVSRRAERQAKTLRSRMERQRVKRESRRRSFEDVVAECRRARLSNSRRFRNTCILMFETSHYASIDGSFETASVAVRARLRQDLFRTLLRERPTPLPRAKGAFDGLILLEAQAFELRVREGATPSRTLVNRWLPTVLFAASSAHPYHETIERCFGWYPAVMRRVALAALERDLRLNEYPFCAARLPAALWADTSFVQAVKRLATTSRRSQAARLSLTRLICQKNRELGRAILRTELSKAAGRRLPPKLLDLAVAMMPDLVWPRLRKAVARGGAARLLELTCLLDVHVGLRADHRTWTLEQQLEVCGWIHRLVPQSAIAAGMVHTMTDYDRLHAMASVILANALAGGAVANPLFRSYVDIPAVAAWMAGDATRRRVRTTVSRLSFDEVLASLERPDHRVIADASHLRDLVMEELALISASIAHDGPLLARGVESADIVKHETDLGLYVRRRLCDRLGAKLRPIGPSSVDATVEQQVQRRGRSDVIVSSATTSGERVQVVIELKWSHHAEVETALEAQLLDGYMKDDPELMHGVYVVAWSGRARLGRDVLEAAIMAQAHACSERSAPRTIQAVLLPVAP